MYCYVMLYVFYYIIFIISLTSEPQAGRTHVGIMSSRATVTVTRWQAEGWVNRNPENC